MLKKYFGTDGIRGRVGGDVMTAEFALRLGHAVGKALGDAMPGKTIVIGKDTRVSGYMLESALEAGLSSAGVNILLFGPMPTPAIAWLTKTMNASAGIVISASHNPYYDNGIKFFNQDGEKLSDQQEYHIESLLGMDMIVVDSANLGKAKRIDSAAGRYIEFCKNTFKQQILAGKKIVIDCANGATYQIAPQVFAELGADICVIGNKPDGFNINKDCGSTDVNVLSEKVLEVNADLGIALDGDGDRLVMVDHYGDEINGDQLIFLIAKHYYQHNKLKGGVVGTLMTNQGMVTALSHLGISFIRADVGDRYVHQQLVKNGWILGGESSGHILNLDLATTGDGIVSALMVLNVIMESGKSLRQLVGEMKMYPQIMINVESKDPKQLAENPKLIEQSEKIDKILGENGRVLIRASGTEPKLRIMVEAKDKQLAEIYVNEMVDLAKTLEV
ncbi:MAG: phosphoglucosamine mutase [Proteobacteria bacterium]|nr:phosphoglucosamine mutase [Pseudomonadota bacterium]